MSNWLKAGLIGAAAVVGLNLLGLIPCVGCITWLLVLVAYGCVGALAAYWMPTVRMAGPAAGQGALAGLIAGAIGGVVGIFLSVVQAAVIGPLQAEMFKLLPPEALSELYRAGIDPGQLLRPGPGLVGFGGATVCCGIGLAIAAGLGALGAIIFVAMRPE